MCFFKNINTNLPLATVRVYYFHFHKVFHKLERYLKLLSDEEISRVNRFMFSKDKDRFVCTRAILRILSGSYLDLDPKEVRFNYNEYGKPSFKPECNLEFNISHSGNMLVIAIVKENEIGVDIEQINYNFNGLSIARNFFSSHEINLLENLPESEQDIAFFRCWTRKEACIKAIGRGLSFPLYSFSVSLDSDSKAKFIEPIRIRKDTNVWSLYSHRPTSEYISAIAVRGKVNSIEYINLDNQIQCY